MPKEHAGEFGYGDVWTFVALDADSKLVVSWLVGLRDPQHAIEFTKDVRSRLANRVQLTSDGHRMCFEAVEAAFGFRRRLCAASQVLRE